MGVDISGWVEAYDPRRGGWNGAIRVNRLVDRAYHVFAALFGVRSFGIFNPVAQERGTPEDRSNEVFAEKPWVMGVAPSWISWSEIKSVDWQQVAEAAELPPEPALVTVGWALLFRLMDVLAQHYGDENVRLVVWFDSE